MSPDAINALFELGGTVAVAASIKRARKDNAIVGLSGIHVAFFTGWGVWNTIYYPMLGQPLSFAAGVALMTANVYYAMLWIKFNTRGVKK